MAKVELNWIAVQASTIEQSKAGKEWKALQQAREAFNAKWRSLAQGQLSDGETIAIAHKPWGLSMAKTKTKAGAKASQGDVFGNL